MDWELKSWINEHFLKNRDLDVEEHVIVFFLKCRTSVGSTKSYKKALFSGIRCYVCGFVIFYQNITTAFLKFNKLSLYMFIHLALLLFQRKLNHLS